MIAVPLALAIVTTSVLASVVLLLVAESVLLGVLPMVPAFRRRVHDSLAREARAAKLAERARLMPAISPCHRSELEELESRVGAIRVRTGCALDRDDWLGLDGLLTLYLRLALAYRKSSEAAFSCAAAAELDRQIGLTEQARLFATEASRPRIEQHLAILQRRRELRATVEERRAVIACDLASIADLVRCLYEECVAADGASASSEVPDAVMEGLRNAAALSELALLRASFVDEIESAGETAGGDGIGLVVARPAAGFGVVAGAGASALTAGSAGSAAAAGLAAAGSAGLVAGPPASTPPAPASDTRLVLGTMPPRAEMSA